jgi:hypothetical protein
MADTLHLLRPTAVDRNENCVHRTLSYDSDGLRDGVTMHQREAATPSRIHPGTLQRQ